MSIPLPTGNCGAIRDLHMVYRQSKIPIIGKGIFQCIILEYPLINLCIFANVRGILHLSLKTDDAITDIHIRNRRGCKKSCVYEL